MIKVSLTTARRRFSKLAKAVEHGESIVITRRGVPIAKLVPCAGKKISGPVWAAAYRRMMDQLEEGAPLGGLKVERASLYDRKLTVHAR